MADEIADALGQRTVETDVTVRIVAGTGIEHRWDDYLQRTVDDHYTWASATAAGGPHAYDTIRYHADFAITYPEILHHYRQCAITAVINRLLDEIDKEDPDARQTH